MYAGSVQRYRNGNHFVEVLVLEIIVFTFFVLIIENKSNEIEERLKLDAGYRGEREAVVLLQVNGVVQEC